MSQNIRFISKPRPGIKRVGKDDCAAGCLVTGLMSIWKKLLIHLLAVENEIYLLLLSSKQICF